MYAHDFFSISSTSRRYHFREGRPKSTSSFFFKESLEEQRRNFRYTEALPLLYTHNTFSIRDLPPSTISLTLSSLPASTASAVSTYSSVNSNIPTNTATLHMPMNPARGAVRPLPP
jgi:hypothetical protein